MSLSEVRPSHDLVRYTPLGDYVKEGVSMCRKELAHAERHAERYVKQKPWVVTKTIDENTTTITVPTVPYMR